MQRIKVEPFLMKKGNRVAKAAIEFDDGILAGFHMVGFTICDDKERGLYVMFPASIARRDNNMATKPFFFLRPTSEEDISILENKIIDVYVSMTGKQFNTPVLKQEVKPEVSK
jgi:hypothetical protein